MRLLPARIGTTLFIVEERTRQASVGEDGEDEEGESLIPVDGLVAFAGPALKILVAASKRNSEVAVEGSH